MNVGDINVVNTVAQFKACAKNAKFCGLYFAQFGHASVYYLKFSDARNRKIEPSIVRKLCSTGLIQDWTREPQDFGIYQLTITLEGKKNAKH